MTRPRTQFYICGLKRMYSSVMEVLESMGKVRGARPLARADKAGPCFGLSDGPSWEGCERLQGLRCSGVPKLVPGVAAPCRSGASTSMQWLRS
jgi:hypothetical protein